MSDLRKSGNRLLLAWIALTMAGILLTGPVTTPLTLTTQGRVFYVVPFQIFAAMGFLTALRFATRLISAGERRGWALGRWLGVLAYVSLFAVFLSYSLETVGYLYQGS